MGDSSSWPGGFGGTELEHEGCSGTLWQPGAEEALTSQAPSRRLAESGRVPGHQTRPVQGAQQPLAALVQGPGEFLALQQAHRGRHVRQRHLPRVAGSCWGKGLGWARGRGRVLG